MTSTDALFALKVATDALDAAHKAHEQAETTYRRTLGAEWLAAVPAAPAGGKIEIAYGWWGRVKMPSFVVHTRFVERRGAGIRIERTTYSADTSGSSALATDWLVAYGRPVKVRTEEETLRGNTRDAQEMAKALGVAL